MAQTGLIDGSRKLLFAVAVVAFLAIFAAATPPAHAQAAAETFDVTFDDEPVEWPPFTDAFDEQSPPAPPIHPPGWVPESVLTSTTVVSAPLPQAIMSGLFMLGGNWFVTRMWKKRKI